ARRAEDAVPEARRPGAHRDARRQAPHHLRGHRAAGDRRAAGEERAGGRRTSAGGDGGGGAMSADDGEPGLRLESYLPYRLSVASNAVSGLIARAYQDRFGLTIPQWRLICVLAEDGRMTQGQIVTRTFMDKVTVSRAAQGLAARHLVDRSENHADGRSHVLMLTPEGRRLFAEVAPLALAYEAA